MGQCFPLPEDENVRNTMQQHAENHEKIFNMYNFDVVPKPGSDMDKAQKLWDKKEVRCMSSLLQTRQQVSIVCTAPATRCRSMSTAT
jgi:arylamine N-acetyltransferase